MKRFVSLSAVLMLLVLLVLPVPSSAKGNAASEARSGVVRIANIPAYGDSWGSGTGFAVGVAGTATDIFITNNHVIAGGSDIYILLDNDWPDSVPAFGGKDDGVHAVKCEIVYTPGATPDYAILKASRKITERTALPLLPAQKAYPGDTIYALGFPGIADAVTKTWAASIDDITITKGTISRFSIDELDNTRWVQVDADIQHGNSGGPLITENGHVIAINTMGYSEAHSASDINSVNLSLEIDYIIEKLNDLIASGKLPGFSFTVIDDPSADAKQEDTSTGSSGTSGSSVSSESTDQGGVSPVIIIVAVAAAAAIAAVVLMNRRKPTPKSPVQEAVPAYNATVKVDRNAPKPPEIPNVPPQQPKAPEAPPPKAPEIPKAPPAAPVKPVQPAFFLIGKDGHFAGKRIPVSKELRMGRQGGCELQFPSDTPGVSGTHCMICPGPNGVYLTDLGSTYGTVLSNGTKLPPNQKHLLKAGESFCVGTVNQKFLLAGTEQSPAGSGAAAKASHSLAGLSGIHAGRRYPIGKELRMGRGSGNDISFPEGTPGISGSHCLLIPRDGGAYVVDLGSSYGTFLSNGTRLPANKKQPLSKGDSFYLADSKQTFRIE